MKRALALTLTAVMLLTALISAAGVLFAPISSFEKADRSRENSLSQAKEYDLSASTEPIMPLGEGERYIVKFKSNASLLDIESLLDGLDYRLIAESESRLVSVLLDGKGFLESNAHIIDYYEPDLKRDTLAITDDAVTPQYYEYHGIDTAWDFTRGKSDIIVAVLDTGVNRVHEDLADVNILAGYDAVARVSGVNEDSAGHGTGVIGIIAATADNKVGIAGVAHGVTILPIKVSSSSTNIYSSDLISGIRFAADAGAKIINMSVGGYSSSYAEQEAVDYAVSKGCILISAAGNGGNRPYADQKSYPASYDGVVSVASCNINGERSSFSQYNDSVDIAAVGENVTMPFTENGNSIYRTDSGTSYSCAIVSGIAALAASHIDAGARFGGDEFLSLIAENCGQSRSNELGHGIINAHEILSTVNTPIITGVYNGGVYSESVHAGFNRGTALLNGEDFKDGDAIIKNGRHTLTVTDVDVSKTIVFRLDYDPLSYEFKEFAAFSYFVFERGYALLDGFPYKSGDRITASGRHDFVLSDGDEIVKKEIYLQYSPPSVYGIEDGGKYNEPVHIRIIGDGKATLNGEAVYGEAVVAKNGRYTLTVTSGNGSVSKSYTFDVTFDQGNYIKYDYAMGSAAVDEENGYVCLYGESLVGARIYNIEEPEKFLHFLALGRIYSHAFTENELLLFGEKGVSVINRTDALNAETAVDRVISPEGMNNYCFAEQIVYCFDNTSMYTLDLESGTTEQVFELGFACAEVFYDNGVFCLVAENGTIYKFEGNALDEIFDMGERKYPLCFEKGYLAVGNRLYDIATGKMVLEFASDRAVRIENRLLFTDRGIVDIASGRELGVFNFNVSDIVFGVEGTYLFGAEPDYAFIANGANGISAYGAAPVTNAAFTNTQDVNIYRKALFYDIYSDVVSVASGKNNVFVLLEDRYSLYSLSTDGFAENNPIALKYEPDAVFASDGYVAVTFKHAPYIFICNENDIENGRYIELSDICRSAFIVNGRVYAVSGDRLVYFHANSNDITITDIQAESAIINQGFLYVLNQNLLTLYQTNLTQIAQITVRGNEIHGSNGIAVGGVIYDNSLQNELARTNSKVLAFKNNTVVTSLGIFDLQKGEYVGNTGVDIIKFALVCADNSVITFGSGIVSICSFGDGSEIVSSPDINGVSENSVYIDSVVIEYNYGIGYLDGDLFESGSTASGAGRHVFEIALPCGRNISTAFTIEANIEKVEFLISERVMSVGEVVTPRIRYLPDGASSVPVTFTCDSDGLSIGENGEISALEVGIYTITATAVTDYGSFSAECTIIVRDDLIAFNEDSGLSIDRDGGFILGIKAGTTVNELVSNLSSSGEAFVLDQNGARVTDYIGTNDTLVLQNDGEITDSLIAVIAGDTDGDGFITAYDLYTLERILRDEPYDEAFVLASDVNRNGIIADNDYRDLKNNLLYIVEADLGTPNKSLFGLATIQTVSRIESESIIDVVICISGGKYTRAVSGAINFSEGLEFIEGISTGWQTDYRELDNRVSFYSFGHDGKECGKAFKLLINLRFRVTAEAGSTISFSSDGLTAVSDGECSIVRFEATELFVYEQQEDVFNIDFNNAYDFDFDIKRHEYSATIPYNSALADISVTKEKGQSVSISSLVIPDNGSSTLTVTLTENDGKNKVYTIRVKRDAEPRFDTNCRLSALEIEGFRLTPSFDPEILSYNLTVPYGTEKISVYCTAQSPTASVIIGDTTLKGDETVVTVTVGSPDGERLKYVIHVFMLPPEEETTSISEISTEPIDDTPNNKIFIVIFGVLAAIVLVAVYLRIAKRDEEIKREEDKTE